MKLGDIVREFRQSHGMTMQEFADLASLSKGYISMLEKGRNPRNGLPITPSIDTYAKIARAMNMTAEELLAKAKGEDVAIPAPAAEPMGLTARDERDIERFDPVKAIFDDSDVRSLARDRLKGVSKEEIALRKQQLKAMVAAMWMKEENEK
ncbi:MAG: helix-turn-helix transcriptional regulator [Veillonellaceae bacterium]|nr:helix-turn-helix transcriptional regulator [Veillonellaceae bacterium]